MNIFLILFFYTQKIKNIYYSKHKERYENLSEAKKEKRGEKGPREI